jgi:ABC-2 type transport system ATP-binding protein
MTSTTTDPGGPAILTRGLSKSYGHNRGLVDLDLEVHRGEVMGFIGPNGAGKSTTIRLLLDLIRPSSGHVEVLGEDPRAGGAALRRRIGYLAGDLVLPERMTGQRVTDLMLTLSGSGGDAAARARVHELADRLGLDLNRQSRALSKGNRQKIGIVAAFAHAPELLVLDEPTSGLDPLVQQTFHAMVREAAEGGATVFMSSHIINEVEQTAHRVAVLREGRLIALSTVAELRARSLRQVEVEVTGGSGAEQVAADLALVDAQQVHALNGGTRVSGSFPGEPADLLRRLSAAPWRDQVDDLVVAAPDLEDAVLRFYAPESAASSGTSAASREEVPA